MFYILKMEVLLAILALNLVASVRGQDISHSNGVKDVADESERIEVCIKDLGCYNETKPEFTSSAKSFAWSAINWIEKKYFMSSRETVGTEFRFWAPGKKQATVITNGNLHEYIVDNDPAYDPKLKAVFIIHGYKGGNAPWAVIMKDVLMKKEPSNIFIVDWSGGAGILYGTARANTRIVGMELGQLIYRLGIRTGMTLDKVHIIGHSLGSHAAGFAGEWLKFYVGKTVRRITGLDVAGPDFENLEVGRRLDRSDAEFVDTIHSNAANSIANGFGIVKPVGHFDFYPNGGEVQPGCTTSGQAIVDMYTETLLLINPKFKLYNLITGGEKTDVFSAAAGISCNHARAIRFFIESIISTSCRFIAEECNSWQDYLDGKCHQNHLKIPMGYDSEQYKEYMIKNDSMKFYLSTNSKFPYCKQL